MTHCWSEPELLKNYKLALRSPGIYIIGAPRDSSVAMEGCGEDDPYLFFNWPDNLIPYYVGLSESKKSGVKSRLSAHARGKGSKAIAQRIKNSENLYYICIYGDDTDHLEAGMLCLKAANQFSDNVRDENSRNSSRQTRKIRSAMTKEELDYYDNLDYDGRGL